MNMDSITLINRVLSEHPSLSAFGWKTADIKLEEFERERVYLTGPVGVEEFDLAFKYIETFCHPTKTITDHGTSYGFKHRVENWHKRRGSECYVANGSFIAAALALGYKYKVTYPGSPNCFFNFARVRHVI